MTPDPTKECVIQSHEIEGIPGGWSISVFAGGFEHSANGRRPAAVVSSLAAVMERNGIESSLEDLWLLANQEWARRAPARDLTDGKVFDIAPKSSTAADATGATARKQNASEQTSPKEYGPKVWGMLDLFGMRHRWSQEAWETAIGFATTLLNPDESPATGCSECYNEWKLILSDAPPSQVKDCRNAANWVHWAHDRVNRKLGKQRPSFGAMASQNHWTR